MAEKFLRSLDKSLVCEISGKCFHLFLGEQSRWLAGRAVKRFSRNGNLVDRAVVSHGSRMGFICIAGTGTACLLPSEHA